MVAARAALYSRLAFKICYPVGFWRAMTWSGASFVRLTNEERYAVFNRRIFIATSMAAIMTGRSALGATDSMQGFYAPAEEAPHARTWLAWASTKSIYGASTGYFEDVQETLGRLAAAIAEHEPVTMMAGVEQHDLARNLCGPKVELVDIPTDDMWARDNGPIFLNNDDGEKAVLDLNFNGWGGKQRHSMDGRISRSIADVLDRSYIKAAVVGEGGGIEFDGEGTLILTDSCWVNDNRNPGMSRNEIEDELKARLGVEKVIWVPGVRGEDITDGHIDGSIRIVRPGVLMMDDYLGDTTVWGQTHAEAKEILKKATDAKGRAFEIVEIPVPETSRSTHPDFFASYANFYIGNGAVYTPQFGDKSADSRASQTLGELFPGRKIVALNVDRIYENGGGIHCVTQQEPA
jgi:agmatine deiminase